MANSPSSLTYRTIQGDSFDSIAFRLFGSEILAAALWQANPDYGDVLIFPAGVTLRIPELAQSQTRTSHKMELPPWMGNKK